MFWISMPKLKIKMIMQRTSAIVFFWFFKYHMNMLLGKSRKTRSFKLTFWKESLHETSNVTGIMVLNFHSKKSIYQVRPYAYNVPILQHLYRLCQSRTLWLNLSMMIIKVWQSHRIVISFPSFLFQLAIEWLVWRGKTAVGFKRLQGSFIS